MQKPEEHKLEDSNVENLGSAEDKAARLAAAQTEAEWAGAGEQVGLEIWRVENRRTEADTPDFGVKRWPREEYGRFYKGDSFIVMHTYKQSEDSEKLSYDLHFWIGADSTQDEYGVAAYKTVELDDLINGQGRGDPVQHRETMGHETALFLSYFPAGLIIKEGGIESGFRHVEPSEYKPHLLQVQRRKGHIRAFEVDMGVASLDPGDCFILDSGSKVYVYHGDESDPFEKNKATALAENMESERGDGSERADPDDEFWKILGGTAAEVAPGGSTRHTPPEFATPRLYSMNDDTHAWEEVKSGVLSPADIKNDDVMLIDCSVALFVCVGSDAPAGEQKDCMVAAQSFLAADESKPIFTPIVRVKEGQNANNEHFDRCFKDGAEEESKLAQETRTASMRAQEEPAPEPEPEPEPKPTPESADAESPPAPAVASPSTASGLYSLAELQAGCPPGVAPAAKEDALDPADFEKTFKMDRAAFDALPKWKREKAKKEAGLF